MAISRSLDTYWQNADVALALLRLEGLYADPPPAGERETVQGLRGGAAVLIVAGFEEFLRNVIPEHFSKLLDPPVSGNMRLLPERLRTEAIFWSLGQALDGPRYQKTERRSRIPDILNAAKSVAIEQLDPSALTLHRNPSASNLTTHFKSLGLPKVFQRIEGDFISMWGKQEASTFIPDKLDEIVGRRHVVAHTADALSISRKDLNDSVTFMLTLALALDNELNKYIAWIIANPGKSM